jgi:hypothetical protein
MNTPKIIIDENLQIALIHYICQNGFLARVNDTYLPLRLQTAHFPIPAG